MPTSPIRPTALAGQVFRGTDAIRRGLLTIDELRSDAWTRVRHDVYADAQLDRDHALACRAALARLPASTVVAGPSAAFLYGIEHAATYRDDVHVVTPTSVRIGTQLRLRVHHLDLRPDELDRRPDKLDRRPNVLGRRPDELDRRPDELEFPSDEPGLRSDEPGRRPNEPGRRPNEPGRRPNEPGRRPNEPGRRPNELELCRREPDARRIRRTSANRTAWDVARWLQPIDAVPIIDAMLKRDLTDTATLSALSDRYRGRRGYRRAQQVFGLAERDAQSPAESRLRVRLVAAGLPRPVVQCPVRVSPSQVLHADLGWPEWQVAVEYDGHWHVDPDQLHRDRQRLNRLVGAGWLVLHVTSRRLYGDFPGIRREVVAALSSRGWQPPHRAISRK